MSVPSFLRALGLVTTFSMPHGASSRSSEMRLLFFRTHHTNRRSDSMITFTHRQLASMRQPGLARVVVAWRAPMNWMAGASSAKRVGVGVEQRGIPLTRDSRPTDNTGAATATRGHS